MVVIFDGYRLESYAIQSCFLPAELPGSIPILQVL